MHMYVNDVCTTPSTQTHCLHTVTHLGHGCRLLLVCTVVWRHAVVLLLRLRGHEGLLRHEERLLLLLRRLLLRGHLWVAASVGHALLLLQRLLRLLLWGKA